jgi:hypothetical protein
MGHRERDRSMEGEGKLKGLRVTGHSAWSI